LALLCSTYSLWRAAAEALSQNGPATETGSGTFKPSPELQALDRHAKQLAVMLREFGLTPSSRQGVTPIVDAMRDDLNTFLAGRPSVKFPS
jgi:P27 family predicted phage terminase small subunit